MSWLDQLTGAAPKSKGSRIATAVINARPSQNQPCLPPVPPTKPIVESCYTAVRQPSGPGDVGQVVEVFWTCVDGDLQITDAQGNPSGPFVQIDASENPQVVACRLARQKWNSERTPFNRPIRYQRDGNIV